MRTYRLANFAYNLLKEQSPIDTGNLRYNAIKVKEIEPEITEVYIDGKIAPYTVYTNEKWVSPKWNGRQNPHEKWIDVASLLIAQRLARHLHGRLVKVENWEDRYFNREYWAKVKRGEIVRNDNITGIE